MPLSNPSIKAVRGLVPRPSYLVRELVPRPSYLVVIMLAAMICATFVVTRGMPAPQVPTHTNFVQEPLVTSLPLVVTTIPQLEACWQAHHLAYQGPLLVCESNLLH